MREIPATISSKGQITLPVEVQRLLGVKPRDRVAFAIEDDQVRLVPAHYTLDSVLASVPALADDDELEQHITAAREERAEQLAADVDRP
jgi:AbrB family looped-hinge helix DNA binding protein